MVEDNIKMEVEMNNGNEKEIKSKLEMDELNCHKCMIGVLEVIDFLESRFPSEQMPQWMALLYSEAVYPE
jgi:hypothetical protein